MNGSFAGSDPSPDPNPNLMRLQALQYLGLQGHASWTDIKAAYRKLSRDTHPDKADGTAQDRFMRVKQAFEHLKVTKGPPVGHGQA